MKAYLFFAYIALGTVQLYAITLGAGWWLSYHWFVCLLIGLLVAYTPFVGSVLAIMGAVTVWGWSWAQGAAMFALPMMLIFIASIMAGIQPDRCQRDDDQQSPYN